ncbi:hypothetical protein [Mameliella sediminis]|uniref:hypothetical protein n=1 Tax=Mameliella sediminis TaxID=2836866 RepID=UPI001C437217|nr:hypothetical protein [Mameliella sediminis]MBY6117041.1 hypothetical protein [Antarctobacter heliothermus]MBY6146793.1 hypothetical protein [Mameliella alba]MBV7396324.1 hypothetical protein [Mameliella sediminis]MBY6160735.1 hypothetical protein [Mameliella alba]MBY6169205.1 hypothetical protein [Mameliella alba]
MRVLGFIAAFGIAASGAMAQDVDKCEQTETWFNMAAQARLDGDNKNKVRRTMAKEMGKDAAGQLVDFIFLVPEAQLTPELGKAARAQCEAL